MKTIQEFCDLYNACREGREWAIANCNDMLHAWQAAKPEWRVWIATRKGVLTDRDLRLFAVYCARSVQHLMTDPRSVAAIDVAERHANGQATDEGLAAAWAAAWAAAGAAVSAAAWDAASAAAWDAASAEAWYAARDAAWNATWAAQSAWLLEKTTPNFD